jgi:ABC-type glutathione transport system ATPase component
MNGSLTDGQLEVQSLSVSFGKSGPPLLDGVTFTLKHQQRLALIGRSGAGKSLLAAALMRLMRPPLQITKGAAMLDGKDLLHVAGKSPRREIFLLFQQAGLVLNPCLTIGKQVWRAAAMRGRDTAQDRTEAALSSIGLGECAQRYPFELSGGMRQRVLIAMALVLEPRVLIADETTTGLDPLTQREVLAQIEMLLSRSHASLLYISHDLRSAAALCPEALVMEKGKIVAAGSWNCLADLHPAARRLVAASRSLEC